MKRYAKRAGFTLIEMMVATTLLSVVAGGIYAVMHTGVDTYGIGVTRAEVSRHSSRVLDQIADELAMAGQDVLYPAAEPPNSSDRITLQRNAGFSGGAISWTPATVIEFRHVQDDPDDGKDNNGNGLIDEGVVVLRKNAGQADEQMVVLTGWVREYLEGEVQNGKDDNGNGLIDEPGLSFDVIGTVWTIRLTLERPDPKGRLITHSVQTSIKTRN